MLEYIVLKNFKCFDELQMSLTPLTLITGKNGAGKSSVLQSLLVIRQSFVARYLPEKQLALNGDLTNLISGGEVLYKQAEDNGFAISIEENEKAYEFGIAEIDSENHLQPLSTMPDSLSLKAWSLTGDDFVYLNAERLAPQNGYKLVNPSEKNYSRTGNVHGDKAVGVLFDAIDKVTDLNIKELKAEGAKSYRIGENVSAWISRIMGTDVNVKTEKINGEDVRLSYAMGISADENVFSPLNTAFGYSYLLPIVVAVLTAKPGGLILLENPEAHLHPAAQFRTGEFLALAAEHGIQLIVETHSDHLLNGVRVAVKNHKIRPENVTTKFFDITEELHTAKTIQVEENGGLSQWPDGFFDEWEKALDALIS